MRKDFMESVYNNNSSKLKAFGGNVSPINAQTDNKRFLIGSGRYYHPPKSPSFDSYASADCTNLENLNSPLFRYLRSGSPAASGGDTFKAPAIDKYRRSSGGSCSGFGSRGSSTSPLSVVENLETPPSRSPPVFKTPVKDEEDVLVMDGILVKSLSGPKVRSSSSSDSSGSLSSGNKNFYKMEICRSWEDSGSCPYRFKCQFAHGKDDLRPTRFPQKNKSEAQICKAYTSGSCIYGSKCRFIHHQLTTAASPTEPAVTAVALGRTQTLSPIKLEHATYSKITFASTDWSPQDDGIEVALSSSASNKKDQSREDVDAYIDNVLNGPIRRKRLPVFAEICPE